VESGFSAISAHGRAAMSVFGRYDPNQPRVPAGNSDGGQWTDAGIAAGTSADSFRRVIHDRTAKQPWKAVVNDFRRDGSLSRQTVVNRDGSAIRSDFSASNAVTGWDERHTVFKPDGSVTAFANSGLTQIVVDGHGNIVSNSVWSASGPEPEARTLPAFFETPPIPHPALRALGAAAALYTWMSSRNSADQTAVLAFRADAYLPGESSKRPAIWVGQLTRDQVDDACPRHAEVQSITNDAAALIDRGRFPTPTQYGTAIHKWIERSINGPPTIPRSPPPDPNFFAEASLRKSKDAGYGLLGSRRIDVLENTGDRTVCVYDIKTGEAGLHAARAAELASTVQYYYPGTQRIIVTEVRPRR
jgi:hypothetical protein